MRVSNRLAILVAFYAFIFCFILEGSIGMLENPYYYLKAHITNVGFQIYYKNNYLNFMNHARKLVPSLTDILRA